MANVCKHLGSMIHASRTMTAELMHRHRSQLGVLGALKRAVFKNNNDLGVAHKYKFGAAYCHSR
eukprot:2073671-Pyramimonas_sp.AAC.1